MEAYILNRKKYIKKTDMPITINQQDLPDGAYQALDGSIVFTKSVVWEIPTKYIVKFIDIFVVGGGSGGSSIASSSDIEGAGGGAGGYTKVLKNIELENMTLVVAIGAGNYGGGGTTSVNFNNTAIQAEGGKALSSNDRNGADGGSGGGTGCYKNYNGAYGGSNGGNGQSRDSSFKPGYGQGTTTRAFGEDNGTLYAGGGGGGTASNNYNGTQSGIGGDGGGGDGANAHYYSSSSTNWIFYGSNGVANTGGGGGGGARVRGYKVGTGRMGGSGVAMIRLFNRRKAE